MLFVGRRLFYHRKREVVLSVAKHRWRWSRLLLAMRGCGDGLRSYYVSARRKDRTAAEQQSEVARRERWCREYHASRLSIK